MIHDIRIFKSVRLAALTASLFLVVAVVLAPLAVTGHPQGAAFLYGIFSPLCHQQADRCFHLAGHSLAVCGRCLGIFSGFFFGSLIFPLTPWRRRAGLPSFAVLVVFSLPLALDVAGNLLGFWISPKVLRLATGGIWGIVLSWYFIPGTADAVLRLKSRGLQ